MERQYTFTVANPQILCVCLGGGGGLPTNMKSVQSSSVANLFLVCFLKKRGGMP